MCPRPPSVLESAVREANLCVCVCFKENPHRVQRQRPTYLVFHGDFSSQRVICVPLLAEAQAQLLHLVLGLQATRGLPRVCVTGARCVELLTGEPPRQGECNRKKSYTRTVYDQRELMCGGVTDKRHHKQTKTTERKQRGLSLLRAFC